MAELEREVDVQAVLLRCRDAAEHGRGITLSAAEAAALAVPAAVRAALCEACRTCRVCGCVDAFACVTPDGDACFWVSPDLCSACAGGVVAGVGV